MNGSIGSDTIDHCVAMQLWKNDVLYFDVIHIFAEMPLHGYFCYLLLGFQV